MIRSPASIGFGAVAIAVLAALCAWAAERPPAPVPADAPASQFSALRARESLEQIAGRPHMIGSLEHMRVREWLVGALEDLGFEVEIQEATQQGFLGRVVTTVTVRNILARKRGLASTGGIALVAHYDAHELAPGAGDDGAGVAAILEAVRALSTGQPLRNDLYVVFTDAEELGLVGAAEFIDGHPWWRDISLLMNFEARGSSGPSLMFETNAGNGWVVREYARADPVPSGSSLYYEVYKRMSNRTDFGLFKSAGVTGLNFAFVEGADAYHRSADTVDNLSLRSLQHHGEHALSLARHFGNLDLGVATKAPDVVFFRLPWVGQIIYPVPLARALSLAVLLIAVIVIRQGVVRRRLRWQGAAAGIGSVVVAGALAAGLAFMLLVLARIVHHEDGSIAGRLLYSEGWYGLAVACCAWGSFAAVLAVLRRLFDLASLAAGALVIPLALSAVMTWYVPGASMLFLWPSMLALLAVWQLLRRTDGAAFTYRDLGTFGVLSVPIIVVLFPLPYAAFIALSIARAPILAVVIVLLLALLLPLLDISHSVARRFPAAGFVMALVFMAIGLATAGAGPKRPTPVDLNYFLDRDAGQAYWATTSENAGPWLAQFIEPSVGEREPGGFISDIFRSRTSRRSPAPLVPEPAVASEVMTDTIDQGVRRLRIGLRPGPGRESIRVNPADNTTLVLQAVNRVPIAWPDGSVDRTEWTVMQRGVPPDGLLVLDIATTATTRPIELVVQERLMSLPELADYEMQRPPELVPPGRGSSDASVFRQRVRID